MVISSGNSFFKNLRPLNNCSQQCELKENNSTSLFDGHNYTSGFPSQCVQADYKTKFSPCNNVQEKNIRTNTEAEYEKDFLKVDEFQLERVNSEILHKVQASRQDLTKNEIHDVKKHISTVHEDIKFGENLNEKNNIMIVNYHFTKNKVTKKGQTSSSHKGSHKNEYSNSRKVLDPHTKHENVKLTHSQAQEKSRNEDGKNTFNDMNSTNERDKIFQEHFPQSSFIKNEFKTASFVDDFLEFNPYSLYASVPKQPNNGCSSDCRGKRKSEGWKETIINDHLSTTHIDSEYSPHVCYMEPRCCNLSCQGIPCRNQRTKVFQPESKMFPAFSETIVSNSCCSRNFNPIASELLELTEGYCCRKKPLQANILRDVCSNLRQTACCSCKDSVVQKEHVKLNEEQFDRKPPTKKKKHFTCCKSGKVDQEELSANHECPVRRDREQHLKYQCCPPDFAFVRNQCQEQIPKPDQKISCDPIFKCGEDCPFMLRPEKEFRLRSVPPKITKSVACECGSKYTSLNLCDNKIDSGRNITIQIIPNCGQAKVYTEHQNTPVSTCPNVEQKIIHSGNNCFQRAPFENQNDFSTEVRCHQVKYQVCNDHERYQRCGSRGKPSFRWWTCNWCHKKPQRSYHRNCNLVETSDCCTTTCQDLDETKGADCSIVTISNCQRVLPIKNTYMNRDAEFLKSLHRLNKGLLKDLFATPCPSVSSACQNSCLHRMRGAPFPLCAGANPLCSSSKPLTTNKCCQYEPEFGKCTKTCTSKDLLFECLKYLKHGAMNESHCDYYDEDCCCCCCCRSYNSCCFCERTRCCERKTVEPKLEEKKSKSCCTRCRSVEAKQSLKNCGTLVSNHCFTKVETVCTNTEVRPRTPKMEIRKRRHCCKRKCCGCCNPCCCSCDRCCYSEPCCQNIHKTSCCKGENFIYCCRCETTPIFEYHTQFTQPSTMETSLDERIELKGMKKKDTVAKGTENVTTKSNTSAKFPVNSTTTEKSTNTNHIPNFTSQRRDVLMKSLTLDLCDLGEKKFSKFGVPSLNYPWNEDSFFADMPHEIFRFVKVENAVNPLTHTEYDPTPCLKPEVLHDIEVMRSQDNAKEQNAGGDIETVGEFKKRYITRICEAFFENNQHNDSTEFNNIISVINNLEKKTEVDQEKKIGNEEKLKNETINSSKQCPEENKLVDDTQDLTDGKISEGKIEAITKNNNHSKNRNESISKTQNVCRVSSDISKKSSNISKTSSSISRTSTISKTNYTSKPFTTKTGLTSFIHSPFRESYKSIPPGSKNKQKPTIKAKTSITEYISKEKNKSRKDTNNVDKINSDEHNTVAESVENEDERKVKTELNEISTSREANNPEENKNDHSTKEQMKQQPESRVEKEIKEQHKEIDEPFDLKKFNEEINAFYEKCFKGSNIVTAEKTIPFYNTKVSDIVKSLETKYSIYSQQTDTQEQKEAGATTSFPDENFGNNITFPDKSNIELYSEAFHRSYKQNNTQIPNKIMSNSDLISFNM